MSLTLLLLLLLTALEALFALLALCLGASRPVLYLVEHMPNLIYTAIRAAGLANKFTNSWLVSF